MSKLNDLIGKDWVRYTKSWFVLKGKIRNKRQLDHPAKFPEELAGRFVEFFTKEKDIVFDPFMGVGSTYNVCNDLNRICYGIEINKDFVDIENNNNVIIGDSRYISNYHYNDVDFIVTSPPYWNILKKKRGNSDSQHRQRKSKELKLYYSDDINDLGNIDDYLIFLRELRKVFRNCYKILKEKHYMVVIVQNFRNDDGKYITLAWDLVKEIEKCGFQFIGEQIWCQDDKKLGIWGYPSTFILNVHHHYCLVFRKNA